MGLQRILVHVADEGAEICVAWAAGLANRYDAHVHCVHPVRTRGSSRAVNAPPAPGGLAHDLQMAPGIPGSAAGQANTAEPPEYEIAERKVERRRGEVRNILRANDVDGSFDRMDGSRRIPRELVEEGICSDLTVVGKGEGEGDDLRLVEALIKETGSPVAIIPRSVRDFDLKDVVIAWNGSREAARAVRHALPILEIADTVTVAMMTPGEGVEESGKRLQSWLERHGVQSDMKVERAVSGKTADAIMNRSSESSLLIAGAYGRSRVKELLGGGTTSRMVRQSAIPMLLAH